MASDSGLIIIQASVKSYNGNAILAGGAAGSVWLLHMRMLTSQCARQRMHE